MYLKFVYFYLQNITVKNKPAILIFFVVILNCVSCSKSTTYSFVEYDITYKSYNWSGNLNRYVNGNMINQPIQNNPPTLEYITYFTAPNGRNLKLLVQAMPIPAGDTITLDILVNHKIVATNSPRTNYVVQYTLP